MSILDDFEKKECTFVDQYHQQDKEDCAQGSGIVFSFFMLTIHMIVSNVLLINLLIAMFRCLLMICSISISDFILFNPYALERFLQCLPKVIQIFLV
jgi:hypothetical protein